MTAPAIFPRRSGAVIPLVGPCSRNKNQGICLSTIMEQKEFEILTPFLCVSLFQISNRRCGAAFLSIVRNMLTVVFRTCHRHWDLFYRNGITWFPRHSKHTGSGVLGRKFRLWRQTHVTTHVQTSWLNSASFFKCVHQQLYDFRRLCVVRYSPYRHAQVED